ncbi:uncharacterized protein LOC135369678 [Ornithodoros turicata]|uniref:uncharacterized protein LOC135369678 n=1 Tax=Ornithodoros turicata TaxID=34597 RepID=UPI0031388826
MNNITKNLEELHRKHPEHARECFRRRYQRTLSFYYLDLPHTMTDENDFCTKVIGKLEEWQSSGICNRTDMQRLLDRVYDSVHIKNFVTSRSNQCVFDCCMLDFFTFQYKFQSFYAFDGKPCGEIYNYRNRRNCVLGACVAQNYTLPL